MSELSTEFFLTNHIFSLNRLKKITFQNISINLVLKIYPTFFQISFWFSLNFVINLQSNYSYLNKGIFQNFLKSTLEFKTRFKFSTDSLRSSENFWSREDFQFWEFPKYFNLWLNLKSQDQILNGRLWKFKLFLKI